MDRREELLAVAAPFVLSALLLVALSLGGLDERISAAFFDRASGTWPQREGFWAKVVFHDRATSVVFLIALGGLLAGLGGCFLPRLRACRAPGLFVALSVALSAATVGLLKDHSPIPCPWDSLAFGGDIPHLAFPRAYPPGARPGHCFPGAHAAGAFALMSGYFALRRRGRRRAWWALAGGYLLGLVFSAAQVVRGAHFASHNAWSALVVWALVCGLYALVFRRWLLPRGRGV